MSTLGSTLAAMACANWARPISPPDWQTAALLDMNPILLKPQAGACQVIVRGHLHSVQTAADYWGERRQELWPVVADALDRLRASYDLVIAEGAGSPAEINLRERDLVNMRVALYAQADVLLVADIDRGGAFASLLGTWQWLAPAERALVRGFVLNRFRGDAALLEPAPALLEERTGVPVVGVVPFVDQLGLPSEDAASLAVETQPAHEALVEIAVVRLPHLANFDEWEPLAGEPGVQLRYVSSAAELRAPDLVILPGTKATIPDLRWLFERGLAERIRWLARHQTPVLGTCGGYQMLGQRVLDPLQLESEHTAADGLGLLPVETVLAGTKQLVRTRGHVCTGLPSVWSALGACPVEGYEIHLGRTTSIDPGTGTDTGSPVQPLLDLGTRADGAVSADGQVAGTSLHGLLAWENREARHALLRALAATRGLAWQPSPAVRPDPYDRLADVLAARLRLDQLVACSGHWRIMPVTRATSSAG